LASSDPDNSARPAPGVRLCALDDLADPGAKGFRFRAGDQLFAGFLVRRGDTVSGYVDSCPHAGWPLAAFDDRYLTRDKRFILCSGHGALFTLDGAGATTPCLGLRLTDWPVKIEAGEIFTA
jgi:nitrite reductase/ring-hydroxylating ferredoxin subunit